MINLNYENDFVLDNANEHTFDCRNLSEHKKEGEIN
jgi:hypothetical protein